jgi:hypothetical protein
MDHEFNIGVTDAIDQRMYTDGSGLADFIDRYIVPQRIHPLSFLRHWAHARKIAVARRAWEKHLPRVVGMTETVSVVRDEMINLGIRAGVRLP